MDRSRRSARIKCSTRIAAPIVASTTCNSKAIQTRSHLRPFRLNLQPLFSSVMVNRIALTLLLCVVAPLFARAQGATIHATSRLYDDGTRSNTVVDAEKRTAEETLEDSHGKTLRKVTYLMDDQNQYIGSITYDPKGTMV